MKPNEWKRHTHTQGTVTHLYQKVGKRVLVRPVFLKLLLAAVLLMALLGVTGCTALHRPEELAWQGMHVYDTLQTADIVGDPCYGEGHPMTKMIIGDKPTKDGVLAWGVGSALFHAGVSNLLLTRDHPTLYKVWQTVTILDTGASIGQGISIGVRVGAPNTRVATNGCAP